MMLTVRHQWLLIISILALLMASPVTAGATPSPVAQEARIPTVAGTFVPLPPARVLDTASGNGASANIPARSSIVVQVGGRGGVPASNVASVVLNLQAVTPATGGYLTLYAGGANRPTASNLNFTQGTSISTLAVAPLSPMGAISVYNGSNAPIRVIADLAGYYLAGTATVQGAFASLAPTRILDTSTGNGATADIPGKSSITVQVSGRAGVPGSGVGSAVLNLQAVTPGSAGYLTVHAAGSARPAASQLNFTAAVTISTLAVATLSAAGAITIYNGSTTPIRVIADLAGYHIGNMSSDEGSFFGLAPQRLLDTGTGNGAAANIPARGSVAVQITGRGGVPISGVADAVLTLQAVTPAAAGYLTLYAAGSNRPTASNLNFTAGKSISTLAVAPLSVGGAFTVYNGSNSAIRVIADIAGYHLSPIPTGAMSWGMPMNVMTGDVLGLSCVTRTFCAAVSNLGQTSFFNGMTWSASGLPDAGHALSAVSCSSPTFCVAGDFDGRWLLFNGANWGMPQILSSGSIRDIACPTSTFCIAVTDSGSPNFSSQISTFNGASWTSPSPSPIANARSVSCSSANSCHLVGDSVSKTYNGFSWSTPLMVPISVDEVSCATPTFCQAGASGQHTTNVTKYNGANWSSPTDLDGDAPTIGSISCATANFCISLSTLFFINGSDGVLAYQYNGASWSASTTLTEADVFAGPVSCATEAFCVAGVGNGQVVIGTR